MNPSLKSFLEESFGAESAKNELLLTFQKKGSGHSGDIAIVFLALGLLGKMWSIGSFGLNFDEKMPRENRPQKVQKMHFFRFCKKFLYSVVKQPLLHRIDKKI